MIAPFAQIAPRLKKLLLMLSSDRDGEVVAAVRAIDRTLKSAGADWHDLTGLLTAAPAKTRNGDDGKNDGNVDWRTMREFCAQRGDLLQLREWDFVNDLQRWQGDLTERQSAWLRSIYARVRCAT